jgi:hypothetical protein
MLLKIRVVTGYNGCPVSSSHKNHLVENRGFDRFGAGGERSKKEGPQNEGVSCDFYENKWRKKTPFMNCEELIENKTLAYSERMFNKRKEIE